MNDGRLPLLVDRLFSALLWDFSVRHFMALSLAGQGRRSTSRSLQLYRVDLATSVLYIATYILSKALTKVSCIVVSVVVFVVVNSSPSLSCSAALLHLNTKPLSVLLARGEKRNIIFLI